MKYIIISLLFICSCATTNTLEKKRISVLDCVVSLKQEDTETMEAFEVCRQVYRLKKVK